MSERKIQLKVENPYLPTQAKVLRRSQESADVFTLTLSSKLKHAPGQFVQVYVPQYGECPISICSASGENLKLSIRQVGNVTNALSALKKGDIVYVRGPYGKGYPMQAFREHDLVIVGGGCGVAPLKGIIEYVERNRRDFGRVDLFLGFRSPDDILYKKEQLEWKKKYGLNVSVDKAAPSTCYEGKVGFVTEMLKQAKIGKRAIAFLCGPPAMMNASADVLIKQKGFTEERIYVSAERLMQCAVGKCCHCMIRSNFTCMDGPVFRFDELSGYAND